MATKNDPFSQRRHARVASSYDSTLEQLNRIIPSLAAHGDQVAVLFDGWVKHALKVKGDTLRKFSNFDWNVDTDTGVLSSFKVGCKAPDAPGDFIRVGRVYRPEGLVTDSAEQLLLQGKFRTLAEAVVERKDNYAHCTLLVTGAFGVFLVNRLDNLVYLREDNGLHMLFRDGQSKDVYLEVYLGGAWQYKG